MSTDVLHEARRQAGVCNACRYCEGYCSVFPALHRERMFTDETLIQLANLCHNCRGCYYACQYAAPHAFAINMPRVLAEVRHESWQSFVMPVALARAFHRSGTAIAMATVAGLVALIWAIKAIGSSGGEGFYAVLSHNAMVAIFGPAFILPTVLLALGIRRYWRTVGGGAVHLSHLVQAFSSVAEMRELSGGYGDGCNFEDKDRFSQLRRWLHQSTMYGFLLCLASTSVATLMHYAFDLPAPYSLFSVPKILGLTGGVLLSLGTLGMAILKLRGERNLADACVWEGEMAFILLLFVVSTSGLALYLFAETAWLAALLAFHLGAVLAFFLLTPYSKMAHGFFRLTALVKEAHNRSEPPSTTLLAPTKQR